MDMSNIKGTKTDQDGYEKAKKDRWVDKGRGWMTCKKHDTLFKPEGDPNEDPDAEPCWACWHEFQTGR